MKPLLLVLLASTAALAQSHGYVFAAPGVASVGFDAPGFDTNVALLHLGAGGEGVFRNGVGVGADIGLIGRTDLGAIGAGSINGSYHFRHQSRAVPFVTGGYSRFFNFDGGTNLANAGGGVNLWILRHLGVKLEVRDHFRGGDINYLEFRFGVTFR
jgi:hypothetical protein